MAAMYSLNSIIEKLVKHLGGIEALNDRPFINVVIPRSSLSEDAVLWPVIEAVTPFQQVNAKIDIDQNEFKSIYFYVRNEFQNDLKDDFEILELKAPRNETIKIYYKSGVPNLQK